MRDWPSSRRVREVRSFAVNVLEGTKIREPIICQKMVSVDFAVPIVKVMWWPPYRR